MRNGFISRNDCWWEMANMSREQQPSLRLGVNQLTVETVG
jgi:hypothetical protein